MTGASGKGRYTVIYEGDPMDARILNGEPAPGTAVYVGLGDRASDLDAHDAEIARLTARLAEVEECPDPSPAASQAAALAELEAASLFQGDTGSAETIAYLTVAEAKALADAARQALATDAAGRTGSEVGDG